MSLACETTAVEPQDRDLSAFACAGHLEQILDNLLANAIEATPSTGHVLLRAVRGVDVNFTEKGGVGVRVGPSGAGVLRFEVEDTGPGVPAAAREAIFEEFEQGDGSATRRHGGTGLGLAIVAQLARMSGGTAWLDASPSGGIDAVVRLEALDG